MAPALKAEEQSLNLYYPWASSELLLRSQPRWYAPVMVKIVQELPRDCLKEDSLVVISCPCGSIMWWCKITLWLSEPLPAVHGWILNPQGLSCFQNSSRSLSCFIGLHDKWQLDVSMYHINSSLSPGIRAGLTPPERRSGDHTTGNWVSPNVGSESNCYLVFTNLLWPYFLLSSNRSSAFKFSLLG